MFGLNKEIVLDDSLIEKILSKIQTFEITVSIRTNLFMIFRDFSKVPLYIKFLINGGEPDITIVPSGLFLANRILEHPELPKEFKPLYDKLYEFLRWNNEFLKIETHNKFFIESALGSLELKINKASDLLKHLFKLELNRLGLLNVLNCSDDKLKETFPDLFLDYKNPDGSTDTALWDKNLKDLKEFIGVTFKSQT